jgi:hypothetical protein
MIRRPPVKPRGGLVRSAPKMAALTFLVVCALIIGAALTFQDNAWKHILSPEKGFTLDPPWLGGGIVVIALVALLLFGLMGIGHAAVNAQYADFVAKKEPPQQPEKTPAELRADDLVKNHRYHDHGGINVRQPDGPMKTLRLLAQPPEGDEQNIINRNVILQDEEGNESAFNYSVLFHDYSWKKGSERLFQGKHSKPITLETALHNEYLRKGVEKAPRIVCFGLASSELSTMSPEDNEKLSDARAGNLCQALYKIGYITHGPQTAIAVGAGHATREDVADPDLQRVAIIIGVQHTTRAFSIEAFVLAINELIDLKGLDLEQYSRRPDLFVMTEGITPGDYISINDVEYVGRANDIIVPVIPKRAESVE